MVQPNPLPDDLDKLKAQYARENEQKRQHVAEARKQLQEITAEQKALEMYWKWLLFEPLRKG